MRLTTYTDYSLRALMYLALRDDERVTVDDIAAAYDISRNHLTKIVHELGRDGYLATTRGRGGGIRLARPPAEINIGEVVRRCERQNALVECFGAGNTCCITSACVLRSALAEAREAFMLVLDGYTLADLVRPRRALAHSLGIPA
jgi:Rrf2 family nitric oxide-sensitive transcriptional repressor